MAFLNATHLTNLKAGSSGRPTPKPGTAQLAAGGSPSLGIALKLLSTLMFSVMVVALKFASDRVPIGEMVFARNLFGLVPVLLMVALRGELAIAFRTHRPWGHVGRAVVGITAMCCGFTAFALLPLPDATAIGFATPLIVVVLAWLILGEQVRVYRWSAVGVGFLGILVILSPHLGGAAMTDTTLIGAICAFGGAFFGAFAMIFVRRLTETERTATIVTWFTGAATMFSLLSLPLGWIVPSQAWVMPDLETAGLLILVGIAGGIGQILLTQSYRYADASTVAPFDYANMLWAVAFGWLLFAEIPVPEVLIGAAIVIGAGVFVIFREHRLGLDRTKARRASTPSRS